MTVLSPRRLQVPAAFNAPALDEITGLKVVPGRTEDRRSALYDTADLDLTRWGVRIEHDTQQGWRIELPAVGAIDRHVRVLSGGASVPAQVRRTVQALTEDRRLRRLVRLDVHAVITLLVAPDQDEPVLLLADEQISVTEGRRLVARFQEYVIRPGTGATRSRLDAVESLLCDAGAVSLTPGSSRLLDVLGPRAGSPPAVVDPGTPAGGEAWTEALSARLRHTLHALILLDAHVRLHARQGAVAAYADALRELHAALGARDDCSQAGPTETIPGPARSLQEAIDAVVTVDGRRERIVDASSRLGLDPARRRPLDERIERERASAHRSLLASMDGSAWRQDLADRCARAVMSSPDVEDADGDAVTVAGRAARQRVDLLRDVIGTASGTASAGDADPDPQVDRLLAELAVLSGSVAEVAADASAKRFAKRLRRHRRAVARYAQVQGTVAWLQEVAASGLDATTCFDAGQVAGVERLAAAEAAEEVASTWDRLGRPKATRWLSTGR